MSSNEDRGKPGLQYPEDIHKESVPIQKTVKMVVDNLFFLHRAVDKIAAVSETPREVIQQLVSQTVQQTVINGGGGGGGGGGGATWIVHVDTHAIRLASFGAASDPVGSIFFETDRCSIYYISNAFGIPRWVFAAGMMTGPIANIPTDLGVYDAGFSFVATDTTELTQYVWNGTLFFTTGGLRQIIADAGTNTSSDLFRMAHRSSGTPTTNFGGKAVTELDNAANALTIASELDTFWTAATAGSETAAFAIRLKVVGAALADYFQVLFNGIRFRVGSFFGKFTHANSADRVYTLSDEDGNLVYETVALTDHAIVLGNAGAKVKPGTLGTTVTVLHGNAAGDPTYGAVVLTSDVSGILPAANGGTGVAYDQIAATIALAAQVAIIGSTNFANSGAGSTFRVSYYLETTTADVTAGTIQLSVGFTDDAGATTVVSVALSLAILGRTSGVFFVRRASGNVAYQTILTGAFGTSQYALYICFERLS